MLIKKKVVKNSITTYVFTFIGSLIMTFIKKPFNIEFELFNMLVDKS